MKAGQFKISLIIWFNGLTQRSQRLYAFLSTQLRAKWRLTLENILRQKWVLTYTSSKLVPCCLFDRMIVEKLILERTCNISHPEQSWSMRTAFTMCFTLWVCALWTSLVWGDCKYNGSRFWMNPINSSANDSWNTENKIF